MNLDPDLSLRHALDQHVEAADDIAGYNRELPGLESATRSVEDGRADVGLGLEQSAVARGQTFVRLGSQTVRITVAPSRKEKEGVRQLVRALERSLPDRLAETPGYTSLD